MRVGNFWQWEGRVNRATYFVVGVVAFALKFLLDWFVVTRVFHRPWSSLNYWRPFGAMSGVHAATTTNTSRLTMTTLLRPPRRQVAAPPSRGVAG